MSQNDLELIKAEETKAATMVASAKDEAGRIIDQARHDIERERKVAHDEHRTEKQEAWDKMDGELDAQEEAIGAASEKKVAALKKEAASKLPLAAQYIKQEMLGGQ